MSSARTRLAVATGLSVVLATSVAVLTQAQASYAAQPGVGLGTAGSYSVLAGATVTNTGSSVIAGDLGVSPGNAVTGFPPGLLGGVQHAADAEALSAKADLVTAYDDAAGRSPRVDRTGVNLGGQTLDPGVYNASTSMSLTGTVTLDAHGDPDAIFIFQAGSTLITASGSRVALIGSAQPCHVFWQVGSSATLGTSTSFVGTVLALTSITAKHSATVRGRLLARNGQVSLDDNVITRPACSTTPDVVPSTPTAAPSTPAPTAAPSLVATVPGHGGASPTGDTTEGGGSGGSGGSDGSGGSGGSGGSTGTPTDSSTLTGSGRPAAPVVPVGHPHTGRPVTP